MVKTSAPFRQFKPGPEIVVTLVGTVFSAWLLFLTAMNVGPLWRDEINTINLAQMPSLTEIWNNLPYESFPPLWPLILRGFNFLGMAGSDEGIRLVGLYVGIFFLISLWLCSRWTGGRAPTLSIGLLGCLPAFIFIIGSNRAYGLASCLLVLSFGLVWRMIESFSKVRAFWAGVVCVLFAQCVYYDVVFLMAMLFAGALVVIRRRRWKVLWALVGIGAVAGGSMAMYLGVVHRGSVYVPMNQDSSFRLSHLWYKLSDAMTARTSAQTFTFNGHEIWLWLALLLAGMVVAIALQLKPAHQTGNQQFLRQNVDQIRADLALFCGISLFLGAAGFMVFLVKLRYLTESWYYVEMLCLCAISLDGLLGAIWPAFHPWGRLRIGFMIAIMAWFARAGWAEAHTQRSNIDLAAAALSQQVSAGDLIIVQTVWDGITFDRYYAGSVRWVTVPPMASHKLHRNDLALALMKEQEDPMASVLHDMADTLRAGKNVWMVGQPSPIYSNHLEPPSSLLAEKWVPHIIYWSRETSMFLRDHAQQQQLLEIPMDEPVNLLENSPLLKFSGYKSITN
jgi:hypothetical protein